MSKKASTMHLLLLKNFNFKIQKGKFAGNILCNVDNSIVQIYTEASNNPNYFAVWTTDYTALEQMVIDYQHCSMNSKLPAELLKIGKNNAKSLFHTHGRMYKKKYTKMLC